MHAVAMTMGLIDTKSVIQYCCGIGGRSTAQTYTPLSPVVGGRDKSQPLLWKISGSIPRAPLGFEHNFP